MSRFTGSRRAAIAVWTGAAIAWASTLTGVLFEVPRQVVPEAKKTLTTAITPAGETALPVPPPSGLLVIRHEERATQPKEIVKTIVVPAPSPAPVTRPAPAPPQPSSSGS